MANGLKSESEVRQISKEFETGYEIAFGTKRVPQRGIWRWDERSGRMVELGKGSASSGPDDRSGLQIMTDGYYDGLRATDGTDIGSRRKHREYMKANNLALADDYKETWSKAQREREKAATGQHDKKNRRESIERTIYDLKSGRKTPPKLGRFEE